MTCDVLAVGAALVDILGRCDEDFLAQNGLTKSHMHLIDADRAAALEEQLGETDMVSGGSVANTCLGIASFGGSAAFLGCVKNDWMGEFFASDLGRAGVFYTQLASHSDAATGRCYCLITPDGERTMCTYLGASGDFGTKAVESAMVSGAKILFVEGYIWDTPDRAAAVDLLIKAQKAQGGQVALTLSDAWCADKYRDIFMGYCRDGVVDILFGNEAEITTLLQAADFDAALDQARSLAGTVVLTRGANGATMLRGAETVHVAAVPIEKLVDATGAGDQFAAGFLYGYVKGASLQQAGQLGAIAAAEVISHIGARPQQSLAELAEKAGLKIAS